MEIFKQSDSGLLGSNEDTQKLYEKEEAAILVISDSHRNKENLRRILLEYSPSCDALVFCGDGIWDFVSILDEAFLLKEMRKIIPPVCAFVQGNGDPSFVTCEFDPVPQNKNPNLQKIPYHLEIPKVQILNAAGKKIFISHGHLQSVDYGDEVFINEANTEGCSIILHGHTHISRHKTENGIHIINPGSISLPRGGTPASFAILTIHGQYIDATFKKISKNSFESFNPLW